MENMFKGEQFLSALQSAKAFILKLLLSRKLILVEPLKQNLEMNNKIINIYKSLFLPRVAEFIYIE